jgi:hypothetical protein
MEFILSAVIIGLALVGLILFRRRAALAGTWHDAVNDVTHKYWRGHKAIHGHGVTGIIKAVELVGGQPHILVIRDDNGKGEHWPAWIVRDQVELDAHASEHW